jgi:hypothetical protein
MLCELGMPSISSRFPIPKIQPAFDEAGNALDSAIEERSARFAAELDTFTSRRHQSFDAVTWSRHIEEAACRSREDLSCS